jgi:hypothetical protein
MGSVSWRKRGHRYLVSWRLDDGSQGGKTVDTPDEARDLAAQKRLEMRRGTWRGRQRGRLSFNAWATEWWETWGADQPSPPRSRAGPVAPFNETDGNLQVAVVRGSAADGLPCLRRLARVRWRSRVARQGIG